jgi:transaldolase/glucose-6-phosphate isomerase
MDLKQLHRDLDQSLWLDYIRRDLLQTGELQRLVDQDGIRGVTSNPSIFEKAIDESQDYAAALDRLVKNQDATPASIYEQLATEDLQRAADVLRPLYDSSERRDGYVSMEVSPHLARETRATVDEASRLWKVMGRDNVMIKVPGTAEGLPAIKQLLARGINVNVTLLFSRTACREVFEAYMSGIEALVLRGGDPARVASVASMFVSRLDTLVDPILEARAKKAPASDQGKLRELMGTVAIANAKLAYQDWKELCASARWQALAQRGARPQRLLWASTGTKDPRLPDVLYAESLMGRATVDTIPPATLAALRDHGTPKNRLEENIDGARRTLEALARANISIDELTTQLLKEGIEKFCTAYDKLLASINKKLLARSDQPEPRA